MKSYRRLSRKSLLWLAAGFAACAIFGFGVTPASGEILSWLRNIEAGSALESVFFRAMRLPGGDVLYRKSPRETRAALSDLLKEHPKAAEFYSLRAIEDEQQLDFAAAENDWKLFAANSAAGAWAIGKLALADFYHRRLRPPNEIQILSEIANAPSDASEKHAAPVQQHSWQAFERIFGIIRTQALPVAQSTQQYRDWLARYPREASLYSRYLDFLVAQKDYNGANQLIAEYRNEFPGDDIFPVKANALVEFQQGSVQRGLAVYEKTFQPLWAPELIAGYFGLLNQTHGLRGFLDESRAAVKANPEDISATARIFYYYQQQGKLDAAQEAITTLRLHKEAAKSAWTARDLYVCAHLLEEIHSYPEAARFYFALYNATNGAKDGNSAQEQALAGLARLLMTAPETPIRLGSGELSMYRDIGAMDQGPGYLNGILSLILNTASPSGEFAGEEQRAVPYFHRSRAAELLGVLDAKFPNSSERPELHERLLEFYAASGESAAVIKSGKEFLAVFSAAAQRTAVALLIADAYARTNRPQEEFAIYDSVLQELARRAEGIPLGGEGSGSELQDSSAESGAERSDGNAINETEGENHAGGRPAAFQVSSAAAQARLGARSPEYARVLERYLARLVELKEVLQALAVLRREIDHNPNDAGLYERLAVFLEQNRLGAEQEEVYRRAMARFTDRSWYHKLARYYLRTKRDGEFEALTLEAVKIFNGTELESYFQLVVGGGPELYLRLNLYANRRFPHNPVFVRNLLGAYTNPHTRDPAAWVALLRQHWFEEADLRNIFFEYLSATGKLDGELASLQQAAPDPANWKELASKNPAAADYIAQAELWRSHYEESAPALKSLAEEYPAAQEIGDTAASVFRSLAYFDPANTATAVKITENLLAGDPGNTQTLAHIGDIYADRELFEQAAPYWERIAQVAPGEAGGYLDAAAIYWDYFDFDNAVRLLNEGRKKLSDDDLYCYEAGAIYEGKRQYPQAIQEYMKGSLAAGLTSQAAYRLLDLARRPKYRDLIARETEQQTSGANTSGNALSLRVSILEALDRKKELSGFLDAAVARAVTIEQAAEIEGIAQQKSLEPVREHALEKEASLAADPVARLQLRYTLVNLYESHKDMAAAQRNIEALYRENPRILGVVRSTVDFYWRTKAYPQAIAVLQQAAKSAYPGLATQFTFEAARKSTEARLYPQARDLLAQLLKDAPYDSQYLAAMADTYAQAGDQQGLKQFYLEKIALFRDASLSADQKKAQIGVLRRGLIPALARMDDHSGAVDQYIELINAFPEDEALVGEASLYALRYRRQKQLTDFYAKTVQQSPRDYRWSMVLARMYTNLEDYSGAIDVYGKSIAIRPDRVDLRVARAGLNERLMNFDDAVADYDRIYLLAYKDSKWMEKIAEVRARHGQPDATVAALKVALIDSRPERAANYFESARRLEAWEMLPQARSFAEQGVAAAGADLLAATENNDGAKLYVRIMTRLRQHDKAYATLQGALSAANAALPVLQRQVAKEGIAAVTDAEYRRRLRETRIENARRAMNAALTEMGGAVARYFAPEEKAAFAQFAGHLRAPMSGDDAGAFAIPLAQAAGLADLEATWRYELMLLYAATPNAIQPVQPYVDLQRRRLKFAELATNMEAFAARVGGFQRPYALLAAADAYRSLADPENELRVLSEIPVTYMSREARTRFLESLLIRRPQQLVQMAAGWYGWGQEVADFVVANGDAALAHAVVNGRAAHRVPVWSNSYHALVGLYFAEPAPEIGKSFTAALGDETIGERLGKQVNRDHRLAGDIWYYYGSRYGEYLATTKQPEADDFLVASLEQSPASSEGYLQLADYYAEVHDFRSAIADYNHALELTPGSVSVRDRLALAYFRQGERQQAVAQWKNALAILLKQVNASHLPESFWPDFDHICDHLGSRHVFAELKPEVDSLLRAYLHRNGNYRSNAPLRSAYLALHDPAAATAWLLDLSSVAPDPTSVLSDVADAKWIPAPQRAPIYRRILEAEQNAYDKSEGLERESALASLRNWQARWANYLVETKQFSPAADFLAALPPETRSAMQPALTPIELQAAAHLGTLDAKIAAYRADPPAAPSSDTLRQSVRTLFESGDKQSARKLLEFVFAREIDDHRLLAANFLGLAEIRLAAGDTPGALELLRRLVVVVGNPFENLEPAAALLEKTGHNAEAAEFLEQLVKSTPWEPSYRLRLANAKLALTHDVDSSRDALVTMASTPEFLYSLRINAAAALAAAHIAANLPGSELNLLADGHPITVAAANQPFFHDARLRAAQAASDPRAKIDLLRAALADSPARDDARVPLFYAAGGQHADELALAAVESVLAKGILPRNVTAANPGAEEEEIASSENEEENDAEESADSRSTYSELPTYVPVKLSPAQQAQLAATVAETMIRVARLNQAVPYLEIARTLEKSAVRRKQVNATLADVKARLRRRQANLARQPILHQALEQDRIVRPRLLAHAASPPAPDARKGAQP